jgi:hypothetical protein
MSIGTSTFTGRLAIAPVTAAATGPATAAAIGPVEAATDPVGVAIGAATAAVIAAVEVIAGAAVAIAERIRGNGAQQAVSLIVAPSAVAR